MSRHRIYIDQSGKVENTELKTVVAYSDGINMSIEISGSNKRKLQKIFRSAAKPNIFVYKTFSCLIYLLIKNNLASIEEVVIDREYAGQESLIRKYVVEFIRRGGREMDADFINFAEIGRRNNAHVACIETYRGMSRPDIIMDYKDLLKWLF